jgi:hypothetical protein
MSRRRNRTRNKAENLQKEPLSLKSENIEEEKEPIEMESVEEEQSSQEEEDEYSDEKVLSRARKRITDWYNWAADNIQQYKDDMSFALGDQWNGYEEALMAPLQKTNLVFNHVYDYCARTIGYQRKNTVAPQVRPKDFAVSQQSIDLKASMLRGIYHSSDGKTVEQTVFGSQIMGGFGAGKIFIDYANKKTMKQHVRWAAFTVPYMAFFDPIATHPTKKDGRYCGYYEPMHLDVFKKTFPDAQTGPVPFAYPEASGFRWVDNDSIALCYYYEPKSVPTTLYVLDDGADGIEILEEEYLENPELQMLEVKATRATERDEMWCYTLTAHEILEKKRFPVAMLPVVWADGDSFVLDGKEKCFSLVYHARDPQRFANYIITEIADDIKKGRREQWISDPDSIPDTLKPIWQNPEVRQGVLFAKRDKYGKLPEKISADGVRESLFPVYAQAQKDIQSSLGMFDAYRGADSNAQSGIAYERQAMMGDARTAKFFSNLNKFTQRMSEITIACLPHVYDSKRHVGLVDENGQFSTKLVNHEFGDEIADEGEYDVIIDITPSLEFQKETALKLLVDVASLSPEILSKVGDLIVQQLPLENAPQLKKRFQMFVDPNILAMEQGKPPPPQQPDPMQQMMQAQMAVEQAKIQNEANNIAMKREEMMTNSQLKQLQAYIDEQKLLIDAQKQGISLQSAKIKSHAEMRKAAMSQQEHVLSLLAKLASVGTNTSNQLGGPR